MAYIKKEWRFKNAIEVELFHSGKYGAPGQKRAKKSKPTPEQIEKRNQYNREKIARHKLREHFHVSDYFVTLTYQKEKRPQNMEECKADFAKFIRKIRTGYRKKGKELKWIRNIEVGSRGAWHIHLVVNRIDGTDVMIQEAWQHGKATIELMYAKGEFKRLAAYITKTPRTEKRLVESDYSSSRNLPVREPIIKRYLYYRTWKDIKIPDGYVLDEESVHEGINPFTGYQYRIYTLLKVRRE